MLRYCTRCRASVPVEEWRPEMRGGEFSIVHVGVMRNVTFETDDENQYTERGGEELTNITHWPGNWIEQNAGDDGGENLPTRPGADSQP